VNEPRYPTTEVLEALREALVRIDGRNTSDAATAYGLEGDEVARYALTTFNNDPKAAGYFITGMLVGLTLAMREQEAAAA
jgi:hypothetical protein